MTRVSAIYGVFTFLIGLSAQGLAGAPGPARPAPASDREAVVRFLSEIEKPPVAYHARRRLEASSPRLKESAWLEATTEYDPVAGFRYAIVAQGGSERIARRVLKRVLDAEKENSVAGEWHKGNLSHANDTFDLGGHDSTDMLRLRLTPRRRDPRLVLGSALLTVKSGDLVRVEGRLSKSPSFWIRWVDVASSYAPVGGTVMPVAIESTADVRIYGISTFLMTYDYKMVDGQAVHTTKELAER